jgi:hypothetical protein
VQAITIEAAKEVLEGPTVKMDNTLGKILQVQIKWPAAAAAAYQDIVQVVPADLQ